MDDEMPRHERMLRELIIAGTASLDHYIELADLFYRGGRLDATLEILTEACHLDLPKFQRGVLLNEQAQYSFLISRKREEAVGLAEEAISILRQAPRTIETFVVETSAQGLLSRLLWETDRPRAIQSASDALSTIENAIGDDWAANSQTAWPMYFTASRIHALFGRFDAAVGWMRRVVALPIKDHQRIVALVELGSLLRQSEKSAEARRVLQDALTAVEAGSERGNPRLHYELGLLEQSAGDDALALANFEHALQIAEGDVLMKLDRDYLTMLKLEIAKAAHRLGDHRKEARVYRTVIESMEESDANYWECLLSLARCDHELNRFDDARENLETIVKCAPSPTMRDSARSDLVSVRYGVANRDYEAGEYGVSIRELESLLGEAVDDALRFDILLLLGHACVESKRFADARKYYRDLANSATSSSYHRDAANASIALLLSRMMKKILG